MNKTVVGFLRILILVTILFNLILFAQDKQKEIYFDYVGKEEGLNNLIIQDIVSDKYNFIWVATRGGLIKYSGTDIKTYINKPFDSLSINSNRISCLYKDLEGELWVGTLSDGFAKYVYSTDKFKRYQKKMGFNLLSDNVRYIYQDSKKRFWIGYKEGIDLFDESFKLIKRFETATDNSSINNVKFIKEYNDIIWIGTNKNIYFYDSQINDIYLDYTISDKQLIFNDILFLNDDIILATSKGVYKYLRKENKSILSSFNSQLDNLFVNNLILNNYKIYISTKNKGLYVYDLLTKDVDNIYFNKGDIYQIPYNTINKIYVDNFGIFWFATARGIFKKFPDKFKVKELLNRPIDVCKIDFKSYYVLFDNKISKFNYRNETTKDIKVFNKRRSFTVIAYNGDEIYLGSFNGLYKLDNGKLKLVVRKYKNNKLDINGIQFDNDRILISTFKKGLFVYDKNLKKITKHFKINYFISEFIVSGNNIWIATMGGGLYKIEDYNKIENYRFNLHSSNTIKDNYISSISMEGDSVLWVGCYNNGISKYNIKKKQFSHPESVENSFPNNIYDIKRINKNTIWIFARKGISRYNRESRIIDHYSVESGLFPDYLTLKKVLNFDKYFLAFSHNKLIKIPNNFKIASSNTLFIEELNVFDKNKYIFGKVLNNEPILLNYNENYFSIKYNVVGFFSKNKIVKYKVEGLDDNWRYTESNRINFTNLSGGNYKLKIVIPGESEQSAATINIFINPPFWETTIFKITALIVLLLAGLSFYLVSIYRLKKKYNKVKSLNKQKKDYEKKINELKKEIDNQILKNEVLSSKLGDLTKDNITLDKLNEIQQEEVYFKNILKESPQALLITDENYNVKFINKSGLNLFGLKTKTKFKLLDYVHVDDKNKIEEFFFDRKHNELAPNRVEFRLNSESGFVKWIDYYENKLDDHNIIISMLNITKRKSYEHQFANIIDSITDKVYSESIVILLNQDMEFMNFNFTFEKLTGFKQEDLIPDKELFLSILFGKATRIKVMNILTEVLEYGKDYYAVKSVLRRKDDNNNITAHLNFSPLYNSEKQIKGIIITGELING